MSSPACADGYDTPAQQREDSESTTFMVTQASETRASKIPSALRIERAKEATIQLEMAFESQRVKL